MPGVQGGLGKVLADEAWELMVDVDDKPLAQSPITDEAYGSVIVFRDPDNPQLELFCPPGA